MLNLCKDNKNLSDNIKEIKENLLSLLYGRYNMKKLIICLTMILSLCLSVFAGDVAEYTDLGFSPDGKYYVFAQYGVTDKDFEPYAEIYTVDVEKNDFVKNGIYKVNPGSVKSVKSGFAVFEELYNKNKANIDKYCGEKATLDTTLYLRGPESKSSSEEITFKDFINSTEENEIFYTINLVKHVSGKGKTLKSSFFIGVEQKDASGKIISRKVVGNPDFERDGVCDYVIRRIVADKSGKSIVFEIEKQIEDSKGTSFRYMVETFMF